MADLKTMFAGLQLRNPVMISSSGLTNSPEKNKRLEDAGAGALVLKSLFEEQILLEVAKMEHASFYPEGGDYLLESLKGHRLSEYLNLIRESKKRCTIPIVASLNCYAESQWTSFATEIEKAGADAIEINILALQTSLDYKYGAFEQSHVDILKQIKHHVRIPVVVKLGSNLTNPVVLINQLFANGAAGVVLFNRFFQPDIDIINVKQSSSHLISTGSELPNVLRWIGIASSAVPQIDFAASGGVHKDEDLVKAILAGASVVGVCSMIYRQGPEAIQPMLDFLKQWMKGKGYTDVSQFKGLLRSKDLHGINMFERTQFLKYYGKE